MFQGWITPFIDPVAGDVAQRWAALTLPIVIATLAVYSARLIAPSGSSARAAIVEFDRRRLGDRRFSSARLWFSAFAAQTAAAVGIETHLEGDDVLDLELIAIQETMIRSTHGLSVDDDIEALEWLTSHFRREMMDEVRESADRPALSSCWIAFGTLVETASPLGGRGSVDLRLVNAADLGQEVFVTMEWRGGRGLFGRTRVPLVGLVRESDPALLGDRISRGPLSVDVVGASRARHEEADDRPLPGLGQRLLAGTRTSAVDAPLTDQFVSVAQAARLTIADTWGDRWWSTAAVPDTHRRGAPTVRCQLFTESEPLPLRRAQVADRDSTSARA